MHKLKNHIAESTNHYLGSADAIVEIVEYGDFLCEYCATVYPSIKLLLEKMSGSIKFSFRHYPAHTIHPLALEAAKAAEAAALQGKFWYMHDMIFENQKYLLRSSFSSFAESIDLNMRMFEDSCAHKKLVHKVINDYQTGLRAGVDSTPTFFINGKKYNGFDDFESLHRTARYVLNSNSVSIT
jgi:protein-disulfide isomerase